MFGVWWADSTIIAELVYNAERPKSDVSYRSIRTNAIAVSPVALIASLSSQEERR